MTWFTAHTKQISPSHSIAISALFVIARKKKTFRSKKRFFIIVKQGPKKVLAERLASSDIIRGGNKKVILHILGPVQYEALLLKNPGVHFETLCPVERKKI